MILAESRDVRITTKHKQLMCNQSYSSILFIVDFSLSSLLDCSKKKKKSLGKQKAAGQRPQKLYYCEIFTFFSPAVNLGFCSPDENKTCPTALSMTEPLFCLFHR